MNPPPAQALNKVTLSLYREGRDVPLRNFQDWALEQVRRLIPFDSAWWGNAAVEPMKIHWLHLHHCDKSILEAYPPYIADDFFRVALMASPGTSVNMSDLITRARFVRTALYRAIGKRYHVEWSLGTLQIDPVSSLSEFLTLWRHDAKKPFNEAERQIKELLMPHLSEAFRAVRLRHFLGGKDTRMKAWALADDQGFIRELSPAFAAVLQTHWPAWRGSMLTRGPTRGTARCRSPRVHVNPLTSSRALRVNVTRTLRSADAYRSTLTRTNRSSGSPSDAEWSWPSTTTKVIMLLFASS